MPTIMEVAERAGVSMKTVSRVVNKEPHVRPALQQRVLTAIEELGYQPNLAARQLAANRSYLIALIIGDAQASYWSQIVLAAAAECRRFGRHLISETFSADEPRDEVVRRVLRHSRPDGIILPAPFCNDPAMIEPIARSGTPLVRLASFTEAYGTAIPVHERAVSAELVRHLVDLGHRRIALIAPPPGHDVAAERLFGYRDALADAGLPYDDNLVVTGDFSFASGVLLGERLLHAPDTPTAIFAANDGMALGALAAATRMGCRVPEDVAIAGFDDSPASRMVFPALTTVRQPLQTLARAAVLTLLGERTEQEELRHELIIRGSTSGSRELVLNTVDA